MAEPLGIGARVGQYRLTRELGRGGMGVVYEAIHDGIGRRAAIKVLSARAAGDDRTVRRFLTEARAISRVHHPGLVQIYDFGQAAGGAPYILMELVLGETLRRRLVRRADTGGRLSTAEQRRTVRQIAAALAATHAAGIVHRDLKPDNVMLLDQYEADFVKVLDFGIARFLDDSREQLTADGAVIGTTSSTLTPKSFVVSMRWPPAKWSPVLWCSERTIENLSATRASTWSFIGRSLSL